MFIGHKVVAVPTRSLGEPDYFMHPDYQFKKSTTRGKSLSVLSLGNITKVMFMKRHQLCSYTWKVEFCIIGGP